MKNFLIIASAKEIFREVLLFVFTLSVFLNMYFDRLDVSLIFSILIIALQIERVADKK